MSETITENNGTGNGTGTVVSTSWVNLAIEAVATMINAMSNFATMTFGPLGTDNGLCCQLAPSNAQEIYLDKNGYFQVTLALNGKHTNLQTLTNTLNNIMDTLTRKKTYTSGTGWQIVDITNGVLPRLIGREDNGSWVMACDVIIKIYRKDE